ncbi:MAG: putative transporter permease protein [Chloroflexi bacterium]|nr:putative transporter permease protein [Chloroflexota bacterium]
MTNEKSNPKEGPPKQSASEIFLEEISKPPPKQRSRWRGIGQAIAIPALAVFTGLLLGAVFIVLTSESFYAAWSISPIAGLKEAWDIVVTAYSALFVGAIGSPKEIISAIINLDPEALREALYPLTESLVAATPYIFGGLSVALGFRVGLFNIGAEGQIFMGAIFAAFVGYSITGLPALIHIPLTFLAGALGGAFWGFIPGWLKAKTGAHEVINTIMLNYIAFRLSDYLLTGPMQRPDSFNPVSPTIMDSAKLTRFFDDPIRLHLGFIIALGMAWLVWWFLFKTEWGFYLRSVGANLHAARYAGMNVPLAIILGMTLAGALAGMAGGNEVLGVNYNLAMAFSSGYGFDSIAIALMGKSHPLGVVLAALLFGALRNGATSMMLATGIPIDIISIVQAFVLVFVAAPAIIRTIYRLKPPPEGEEGIMVSSWGGD